MKITFDAEKHWYFADGKKVPSVTQILSAVGMYKDLDSIPPEVLAAAADRGTVVHKIVELAMKNELDESTVDPALAGYYEAFKAFRRDFPELVNSLTDIERKVCSTKYLYAGMYDAGGDRVIIDWKTTAKPSPVHGLQLTAYWLAEHTDYLNDVPDLLAGVYLHPDGTYTRMDYAYQPLIWLSCLNVYKWQKNNL